MNIESAEGRYTGGFPTAKDVDDVARSVRKLLDTNPRPVWAGPWRFNRWYRVWTRDFWAIADGNYVIDTRRGPWVPRRHG